MQLGGVITKKVKGLKMMTLIPCHGFVHLGDGGVACLFVSFGRNELWIDGDAPAVGLKEFDQSFSTGSLALCEAVGQVEKSEASQRSSAPTLLRLSRN